MNPNCNELDPDAVIERKLELWEHKLLDLSLRNALLNLRAGRGCLPLAAGGEALREALYGGRELALVPWAREEMVVFSSMKPRDIRVAPGTPRGVAALRDFLGYAATGGGASELPADLADDGIAEALCAGLERLGWQAERGVGRSRFHVSVAVRDAGTPERYRLGVLLDTSARDREITRYNVLEGLG